MENKKPPRLVRILWTIVAFAIYIQCRILYLPAFWMGFPGFFDWVDYTEEKEKGRQKKTFFFMQRDMPRLAVAYLFAFMTWFISWCSGWGVIASAGIVTLVSVVVFSYNWLIMRLDVRKFVRTQETEDSVTGKKT